MPTDHTSKTCQSLLVIAFITLLLLPISALGTRLDFWPYTIGLLLMAISLLGGLFIEIVCAIWLLQKPKPANKSALRKASVLALPPLLLAASLLRGFTGDTLIHDISTDRNTPPTFAHAIKLRNTESNDLNYTSAKASAQFKLYPDIKPLNNHLNKEQNFTKALSVAQTLNWKITDQQVDTGHIEAVDETFWFGFKDDIVIRAVDIRSVSRVGKGDLGANSQRIRLFIDTFENLTE